MKKKLAIRVDSSSLIGGGHVYRCLYLARYFRKKGYEVLFICKNLKGNLTKVIRENKFKIKLLPKKFNDTRNRNNQIFAAQKQLEESEYLKKILINYKILVIDHYGINYIFEKNLNFEGKLIVISDFISEKHFCHTYINFHTSNKKKIQKQLLNKKCQLLLGKKYVLTKAIQKKEKNVKKIFKVRNNVLLFFGTSDSKNYTYKILKLFHINNFKKYNFIVLLGSNFNNEKKIVKIKKEFTSIRIIKKNINFSQFKDKIFFSIGVYSQSFFEKIFYSIPCVNLKILKKGFISDEFDNLKFIRFIKKNDFRKIIKFSEEIKNKKFNGRKIIDGQGAFRIFKKINEQN